ncbi:MAG: hypothetical protein WCB53_03870 [Terriglobales bacterium]
MKIMAGRSDPTAQFKSLDRFLKTASVQCIVLAVILVLPSVIEATRLESLGYANSLLQIQVGNWIIAHHAVPHFGIFSQFPVLPWDDPSWSLQVALAILYRMLGMRALPVAIMVLRVLFALTVFILAGGRGNFWRAIGITVWAQAAWVGSTFLPGTLCSAALFAGEFVLLLRSRSPGRQKLLFWMPLLICVWANLDWRFVIGVALFCLFCAASAIEPYLQKRNWHFGSFDRPALPVSQVGPAGGFTLIASVVSPSSYHSYITAWQNLFGASPLDNSLIIKSLTFREPQHYLLMFLAMWAFFLLGRRQAKDLFLVLALAVGVAAGLSLGTEGWIAVISSVAVIGESLSGAAEASRAPQMSGTVFGAAAALAALVLVFGATRIPSGSDSLLKIIAGTLPVRACDAIRTNHLPRPIYNEMVWGDFLIWYLPKYPVSIDDRYELYGETRTRDYYDVTRAQAAPSSDPALITANTIILSPDNGIIKGVDLFPNPEEMFRSTFPGFHEVYRDDLAVVLSRQP